MLGFVIGLEFGHGFGEALEPCLAGITRTIRIVVVVLEAFHLGLAERVHNLEALHGFFDLGAALGGSLQAEVGRKLGEVETVEQLLDGRSAHLGVELTVFGDEVLVGGFVDEGVLFEVGVALVDNDVAFVVDDLFEVLGVEAEEGADHARLVTDEPDVCERNGEFDMAHAFATHLGVSHFDAATVANNALVAHALELTAVAFPVLDRSKDLFAEKTILFGLEGTVVDRFRLGDFTIRPVANEVRSGEMNRNVARIFLNFHHFFGHITYLQWSRCQDPKNELRES